MSHHKVKFFREGEARHWARCSCRWTSGEYLTQQMVEDRVIKHQELVQRVRTHLSTLPSLKNQRNYYRTMADDLTQSPQDRSLWSTLADELDQRLNDKPKPNEQETLWN